MKIKRCTLFFLGIVSAMVLAISEDEQNNYNRINADYMKSDRELNDLYNAQIAEYKRKGGEFYGQELSRDIFLKKAQQVWVKMRDVSCDYETYESRTGTGFPGIYTKCLMDKTNERINYLKENN